MYLEEKTDPVGGGGALQDRLQNSNISANLNSFSKLLWSIDQGVGGCVLMKNLKAKLSRISVPLNLEKISPQIRFA
jgi:hypothetical protein